MKNKILAGIRFCVLFLALTPISAAFFDDIPSLSTEARNSFVAFYNGRAGVVTGETNEVVSWTPVDGSGAPIPSMIVTQTGTGNDLVTYNGTSTLSFSSLDGNTSRQLTGNLVSPAGTGYTIFWRGRHRTPVPFEGSGNYVYNIGNEINHQRDISGGNPIIELFDGSTTFPGDSIRAYDNLTTVWSTVYNDRSHTAFANGINLHVTGTPNYDIPANPEILIGAFSTGGFNFNGELSELIIFNSALSDADRLLIETWLVIPRLTITVSGTEVHIEWPAVAEGFILEMANSILPQTTWTPVPEAPVITDGKSIVTQTRSGQHRFFRLKK